MVDELSKEQVYEVLESAQNHFQHLPKEEVITLADPLKFEEKLAGILKDIIQNGKTYSQVEVNHLGGIRFPDIILGKTIGIEVKTTKSSKWTTLGNSILASTRDEGVNQIYIFFAQILTDEGKIVIKYDEYEKCLEHIKVTHSPRYYINMDIKKEGTVFDKLNLCYNDLVESDNPIPLFTRAYREKYPGDLPWWIGYQDEGISPSANSLNKLSKEDKKIIIGEIFCLFPSVFSHNYDQAAIWMVIKRNTITHNLRDFFTAGGKYEKELPHIFGELINHKNEIYNALKDLSLDELQTGWLQNVSSSLEERISAWMEMMYKQIEQSLTEKTKKRKAQKIIAELFSDIK